VSRCLECGDKIEYGRSDKKFCCSRCKNKYNNERFRVSRSICGRIQTALNSNHEILERLLSLDIDSIPITELSMMGYRSDLFTSFHRAGTHAEYGCFDIRFFMSATRIYKLHRVSSMMMPPRDGKSTLSMVAQGA